MVRPAESGNREKSDEWEFCQIEKETGDWGRNEVFH